MRIALSIVLFATAATSGAQEIRPGVPDGWSAFPGTGGLPGRCEIGVDPEMRTAGTNNTTIQCGNAVPSYAGIYQTFDAPDYRGKRVRYSALMRTEGVVSSDEFEAFATLWMRVEGINFQQPLMVATLGDRALKGTMGWTPVDIVADLPPNTVRINIGFRMQPHGQMWVIDLKFEEAPAGTPVNAFPVDPQLLTTPRNLRFE